MRIFLCLAATVFALSSCAAMQEEFRARNCNREAGYEQGYNDAQSGKAMESSYSSECGSKAREVKQAYREGYEASANTTSLNAGPDGVVYKGPGININLGGRGQKAWVCEIDIFGKSYSGFGSVRAEAAQDVRNKCEADQNSVHCQNMDCQKAR